jgi:serine/threonine protein kinase
MTPPRWTAVSDSAYAWEAEAIAWLQERLPDSDAFRGWSNFEFVSQDGTVNEVDSLIVTPTKLLLVEIKSRPGKVEGDAGAWTWTWPDGRRQIDDNPLILANRKAKRLAGLLRATTALRGKGVPFVEELVFLSHRDARADFRGPAGTRVFLRSAGPNSERNLANYIASCAENDYGERMDWAMVRAVQRAFEELNIRPIQREFTVGQWKLSTLLDDADVYQDYLGVHKQLESSKRRIRVYPWPPTGPATGRKARQEAAQREFRLVDRPDIHPGILHALELAETERGPAVVFEAPEPSERLDAFLVRRASSLDLHQRLRMVRELADALSWAHRQGLYHRTLTPAAVLVVRPDDDSPTIKIFNWQAGSLAEATKPGETLTWHDFLQVGLGGRDANAVYLAPELRGGGRPDPALLDVFSLGALSFHLLSGRVPAETPEELLQRLRDAQGLSLSAAIDGVDQDLDVLIQLATSPDLADRPTAADFLKDVEDILGRLADVVDPADAGRWTHPLEAERGAELEGGFTVRRRLGSGSTALALEVERGGRVGVLKIARDVTLNERLRQEGEVLRRLRHQHVVEIFDVVEVSGHVALFLELAGDQTLSERIRKEGALTLDLLQRFGEELLVVVDWLEQQGIPHRDFKPENVGVGETPQRKLTLKLFDFSLSNTPADNVRAGTAGYLDPFLEERRPRRWDTAAERYAAAVTLHEMATGTLPSWGDGRQHPITLNADATPGIATERFDPAVRDALTHFFVKALARDPKQRFDTSEAMRGAWRDVFRTIDVPLQGTSTTNDGGSVNVVAAIAAAEPVTPLAVLGLTPRVLNALERLGVHRVGELAEISRTKLFGNLGIGTRTTREIRELADAAARSLADRGLTDAAVPTGDGALLAIDEDSVSAGVADAAVWHIELLLREVVSTRLANPDQRVLRSLTGLDAPVDAEAPDLWPSQRDVADAVGLTRTQIAEVVDRARARWAKKKAITALRDDVAKLLDQAGGVATREELARGLVRIRGTTAPAEADQIRAASAVLWAALEMEGARDVSCRYRLQRGESALVVVGTPGDASGVDEDAWDPAAVRAWVEQLGARADVLSESDPPLAPQRVLEDLQALAAPVGMPSLAPERLLRLAVSASHGAALTPRQELYRRGLPAARAVALAAGSLLGASKLTPDQVRQRVAARFPEAEALPGRPELDRLLQAASVPLEWNDDARAYITPQVRSTLSSTGTLTRLPGETIAPGLGEQAMYDAADEEASELEKRIRAVVSDGRFLALTTDPSRYEVTAAVLRDRFGFTLLSLERVLVAAIREQAEALKVQWPVVLDADATPTTDRAWRNLQMLVQRARPAVERALASLDAPTVLLNPGLFARYDLLPLLAPLQDRARRGAGVVVLTPGSAQHTMPMIDDVPLPVVHPSDWARAPRGWHRTVARVA